MNYDGRLKQAWWTLRIGLGLMAFLAGADKFTNLLAYWPMYLNPLAPKLTHMPAQTLMHLIGVVEMFAGVVVLSGRWTRWGAYIVMLWLIGIALNLAGQAAYFDVAVRDVVLSLAAFTLARLTEVRDEMVTATSHQASAVREIGLKLPA